MSLSLALAAPLFINLSARAQEKNTLWYTAPARQWVEALPIGNGRLGAMIFGQPQKDRVQLNEITIWSGDPNPNADRSDAYKSLPALQELLRNGKYNEAAKLAESKFNGPAPYSPSYQMLGDLNFEFSLPKTEVSDYRRRLDIGSAVADVRFKSGDVEFTREYFSSAPDHVLVQRIAADKPGAVHFTCSLTRPEHMRARFEPPNTLVLAGTTGSTLGFEARARFITHGGTFNATPDGTVTIDKANDVVILLTAASTYALDYEHGFKGGDLSLAKSQLESASAKSYEALKADHVADHRKLFDRVKLDLGGIVGETQNDQPTDQRLKSYATQPDPAFAALFYQFGRYLLISSSRSDNPLPANLQGIWGDGMYMPWQGDYHTNINVQMNYWPAEPANLGELQLPLVRLTQMLAEPGAKTAKAYFGPNTPGWVMGYTTNAWGWTSPGAKLPYGIWFGGSAWMCQHLWEHYAFTRDVNYLKSVYPTMKGAAEFWLANLVEGTDGKLITSPSTSPENNFVTDQGVSSTITEGGTMDRSLVWDLFDNTAAACGVLGVDSDFAAKLIAARDRIRPLQIGKAGQLMEWNGDWDLNSKDPHHRHVSHLFALHPGHQITTSETPELAAAAKKSLELRGDDGTGWSLAWKINWWARLRDGDHSLKLIKNQLRSTEESKTVMAGGGGTYPNLFDAHPPFQIDGNFGFVSGVSELLLQSHERYHDASAPTEDRYYIDLLPALPSTWANGSISGLCARGGFQLDLAWKDHRLSSAIVHSKTGGTTKIRYGGKTLDVKLMAGESKDITALEHR